MSSPRELEPISRHPSRRARSLTFGCLLVLVAGLFFAPSCGSDSDEERAGELVVYCGRSKALVGPILEEFERESGIRLSIKYGKTTALANDIAIEKELSLCDVFFAQDSGHLGALSARGHLQPLPDEILDRVPLSFRDPEGRWVGTSGRARVLVYNPKAVKPDELPASLLDLSDERWRNRIGWAPSNGSFKAHVSYLLGLWGEEKLRDWLAGIKANRPKRYQKNSPQVKAAAEGRIDVGWVNHYYLHRARKQNPDVSAANHRFAGGDAGNLMMVAGVGIVTRDPKRQELAQKLAAFLVSKRAQEFFTNSDFEYPVAKDVAAHEKLVPIAELGLAEVDQRNLIKIGEVNKILKSLGIQ